MLEVKNLTVGYGNRAVLRKVSACFEKGKITGIIGVNGCGKSTLLKSMQGLLPICENQVFVDGEDVAEMRPSAIAKKIACLAQGKSTPDMTVMQMVLHGRFPYLRYPRRYTERDRAIALSAMERVGISALADRPLCSLSGGMRQSAYIAMALAQDSDYLLLDEPTTYLDIAHQIGLIGLLREIASEGKGVVAVMHDLPMAFRYADAVAVLSDGEIKAFGTPDAISETSVIRDVFGVTMRKSGESAFYFDL